MFEALRAAEAHHPASSERLPWVTTLDRKGALPDEPGRMRLLADRPLAPEERAAHDQAPRPGTWFGERGADGRMVTQDATDQLIRHELLALTAGTPEHGELQQLIGAGATSVLFDGTPRRHAMRQRGGIDSDPLVRLLAFRAWGDRDRRWFTQRGVRRGELVAMAEGAWDWRSGVEGIALAWPGETVIGRAFSDARPGERVVLVPIAIRTAALQIEPSRRPRASFVVTDRPRVEPPGSPGRPR